MTPRPGGTIETERGPVAVSLDGDPGARVLLVLAPGAGGGKDSEFMSAIAEGIASREVQVCRFDFPYTEAGRRSPDRREVLERASGTATALDAREVVERECGAAQFEVDRVDSCRALEAVEREPRRAQRAANLVAGARRQHDAPPLAHGQRARRQRPQRQHEPGTHLSSPIAPVDSVIASGIPAADKFAPQPP
jgi:hypothetical protein